MIIAAIMLAQASSFFGGADPMEIIKICTVMSDVNGKVPAKSLRSESKKRGWSKSEEDMMRKICKSSEEGAKEAREYIKKREKSEKDALR